MATSTSFSVPCPSCEAKVPIRDPKLIGRKIDCPKCKYRFVVEEPDDADEGDEAPAAQGKSAAVTTKPGAKGAGKSAAVTGKPAAKAGGPRTRDDDDDRPSPKKKGGSSLTLVLGIGLAVVALGALGVGGYFLLSQKSDDKGSASPGGGTTTPAPGVDEPKPPDKKDEPKPPVKPPAGPYVADITNLLPNDTQQVVSIPMSRAAASALKSRAVDADGGFREENFHQTLPFGLRGIRRVVMGFNVKDDTVFAVLQTTEDVDVNVEQLKASLQAEAAEPVKTAKGSYDYYLVRSDLDSLSRILLKAGKARDNFAVHFLDRKTLVFADVGPMTKFLSQDRQPAYVTNPPATPPPSAGGMTGVPPGGAMTGVPPGGGMKGFVPPPPVPPTTGAPPPPPGGGMKGFVPPPPVPPTTGGPAPPGAPPGGDKPLLPPPAPGTGGPVPPPGTITPAPGTGGPVPPGTGAPTPPGTAEPLPELVQASYLTIAKPLKAMLDRIEPTTKDGRARKFDPIPLLTFASEGKSFQPWIKDGTDELTGLAGLKDEAKKSLEELLKGAQEAKTVGISLTALSEDKVKFTVAVEASADGKAKELKKHADKVLPGVAERLRDDPKDGGLGLKVSTSARPDTGTTPGGGKFPPGGGFVPPMPPGGGFRPPPPPGGAGGPGERGEGETPREDGEEGKDGSLTVELEGSLVVLTVDLALNTTAYGAIRDRIDQVVMLARGQADVAALRSTTHELASAVKTFFEEQKRFPHGALPRTASDERGIPWRPDQRLSWAAELLPYFGDEVKGWGSRLNKDAGWDEDTNLGVARRVLTPLLARNTIEPAPPWVGYADQPGVFAATHFVGVAGVGYDAAEYAADHAKRGVFGYDRVTKKDDLKDKPAETIVLLMVPGTHKAPWLAGGGSTVVGVADEADDLKPVAPFVCAVHPTKDEKSKWYGKRGTVAIMADGKVRFVPEDIDAKAFRAMCTVAGGETVGSIDSLAPVLEEEKKEEVKAPPAVTPVTPPAGGGVTGWKTHTSADGSYSVSLPAGKEMKETKAEDVPGVGKLSVNVLGVALPGDAGLFLTTNAQVPDAMMKLGTDGLFELGKKRLAGNPAAKLVKESKITLNGHPGREFVIEVKQGGKTVTVKTRSYYVKDREYALIAGGEGGAVSDKDVQTFFDSFRLTK